MSYEYTADRWSRFKPSEDERDPADELLATPNEWKARREAAAKQAAKRVASRHDEVI